MSGEVSRRAFLGAAALGSAGYLAGAEGEGLPRAIDAAVEEALKVWGVPGACVAVVRNDEVAHLKGYGVRDIEGKQSFDPDTLFGVASCTKAFASAAAAVLVGQGKLGWDDPVRKHLPWFRMSDPLADREVTLRDLLCHRTGLSDVHDALYYRTPWGPEEVARRVEHLPLSFPFRSTFHYSGVGYFVAGLTIAGAAGKPWHEFASERLLRPLGMQGVWTRAEAMKVKNRSSAHLKTKEGKVVVIPWYPDDKLPDASGRLKTTGRSLAEWVRLQLAGGKHAGKEVVPAGPLRETHTPQVVVRKEGFWAEVFPGPETVQVSHGLGWFIHDYQGRRVVSHGGTTDGFRTSINLVPEARLGIVILANLQETRMPEALRDTLLDLTLGLPRKDRNARYQALVREAEEKKLAEKKAQAAMRRTGTRPSRELDAFVGAYAEPAYREARVARAGDGLTLGWAGFRAGLRHFHHDTFVAEGDGGVNVYNENPLDGEHVTFGLDAEGEVSWFELWGQRFRRPKPR
ncbi:MAG: serine hydrolase [Gemmataceae bacterium]